MIARLAHNPKRQIFFITLLFSCITFVCNAQWTFTETVIQNGKCIPYPRAPQVPYYTQSACEAARQWELSNSGQDYSLLGDGSCTTIITCTPCMGSEIITPIQTTVPGQASAGEVSFDGQFEGKSLYSPHESSAFEDWSKDYIQQLESYGIKSILGTSLTSLNIPLTGDPEFDAFYNNQTINFNPVTPANIPVNLNSNAVDLNGKAGIVQLLRNPEDIKRENDWLTQQRIDNLKPIPKNAELDPIVLEQAPFWTSPEMVSLEIAAAGFVLPFAIALVPTAALGMSIANAELLATPLFAFASENYKAMADVMNGKTPASAGQILVNTATSFATDLVFKKIDGGISKMISNAVVQEISEKMPGLGATLFSNWGPKW